MATLEQVGRAPADRAALSALAEARRRVGEPADPPRRARWAATCCNGRAAGISARSRTAACARAAANASPCTARTSTTPSSPTRSAPSCIPRPRRPRWWRSGRGIEIVNAQGEARQPLLDEFFVAPETDVQRENDLKPGEVAHRRAAAARRPPAATSAHLREADKLAFDWPIADVAVVLERDARGRCRARLGGAGRRRAGAAPGARRRGDAGGRDDRRDARPRGRPGGAGRRHAAGEEPLQAADLCRAGGARALLRAAGQG